MDSGYIDLILGPMFSGKTSYLINIYYINRMSSKLLVINHASDNRYTTESEMVSHDKQHIPCVLVNKLNDIDIDMNIVDRILINEGQLFPDLYELISHADTIVKLQGKCSMCKVKPSIFTLRISDDKEQILIGHDQYKPVCRMCFEIHNIHL
jgi:thymidine kinase